MRALEVAQAADDVGDRLLVVRRHHHPRPVPHLPPAPRTPHPAPRPPPPPVAPRRPSAARTHEGKGATRTRQGPALAGGARLRLVRQYREREGRGHGKAQHSQPAPLSALAACTTRSTRSLHHSQHSQPAPLSALAACTTLDGLIRECERESSLHHRPAQGSERSRSLRLRRHQGLACALCGSIEREQGGGASPAPCARESRPPPLAAVQAARERRGGLACALCSRIASTTAW